MKLNKIQTTSSGKKVDLNNLPISLRGTTAYKNVYYGIDIGWENKEVEPVFIALTSLNEEEREVSGKNTHLWHLSKHDNVLDAAYVAAQFEMNKNENVKQLKNVRTGEWDYGIIPKFEYSPIGIEASSARKVNKKVIQVDNKSADANFDILCKEYNMVELASKFGREAVLIARKFLTINEFQLRFGL